MNEPELLPCAQDRVPNRSASVHHGHLEPTLRPSHALVPELPDGGGGELSRHESWVGHDPAALLYDAKRRIDVFGEHPSVHADASQERRAPEPVGAAEDPEAVQTSTAGMADGVDGLELDRDRTGDPRRVTVAHHRVALHNVDTRREPLPCPGERSRVGMMIGVEHAHELAFDDGERGVHVLRLRGAALDT